MATPAACPKCRRASGSAAAACPTCQAAGTLIDGRYLVEYELGRGQFGVVYRALDQRLARPVAIKMLRQEALDSEDAVRRFQEEARILCQVHHSNVLAVHDQGRHEGKHYIVFPFIEGKTLKELIPPAGFADPRQATRLVARLAEALHYVSARHNILHRDVKPANLMRQDGDENSLFLMDFGLAVCHTTDLTRATQDGTVMGTPRYMSPEQAKGKISETSHRSDLYSAAVVLYELLTGRPPFTAAWPALIVEIIQAAPRPPSAVRAGLDPRLDAIVLKGLAKNPAERFQTGKEFAAALEQWASGPRVAPVTAAAVAVGARPGTVTVKPLPPLEPTPPGSPPAAASGQGSSVVTGSTVNQTKVVVRKLPPLPPQVTGGPPPAPPAAEKPTTSGTGTHKPVPPPAAPVPPPPVRVVPQRPAALFTPPEPPPVKPPSHFKFNLMVTLIALGVLLVGVASVIWAVKSGPSKPETPAGQKGGNKFRDEK